MSNISVSEFPQLISSLERDQAHHSKRHFITNAMKMVQNEMLSCSVCHVMEKDGEVAIVMKCEHWWLLYDEYGFIDVKELLRKGKNPFH